MEKYYNNYSSEFLKMLRTFENSLGLPQKFFDKLLNEDDWSFIIKCHTLIESALSDKLSELLDDRLNPIFKKMGLGNKETGKILFAQHLNIIDKSQTNFIRKFSELRNTLVHDISNTSFQISNFPNIYNKSKMNSFIDGIIHFTKTDKEKQSWKVYARENIKLSIWISTIFLIYNILLKSIKYKLNKLTGFNQVAPDFAKTEPNKNNA